MSKWYLYRDGIQISSGSTIDVEGETPTFGGFTIPENDKRCHDYKYEVVWEDDSGHTATYPFTISSCTKNCDCLCWEDDTECLNNKYTYHIEMNASSGNTTDGYSGACSGEIVSFSAYCENTDSFDEYGRWYMWDYNDYIVYDGVDSIKNYQFEENSEGYNQVYKILYVSECNESANTITYTSVPSDDCVPPPSYKGVDLLLPSGTIWGEFNLGARKVDKVGKYYSWGEISAKTESAFTLQEYKFYSANTPSEGEETPEDYEFESGYTKYNIEDNLSILEIEDDASSDYQNGWAIPTKYHFEELFNFCGIDTFAWLERKDVFVLKAQRDVSRKITLPTFTGYLDDGNKCESSNTYFWTSQLTSGSVDNAITYYISADTQDSSNIRIKEITSGDMARYRGLQIRPIKEKKFKQKIEVNKYGYIGDATGITTVTFEVEKHKSWTEYGSYEIVEMRFDFDAPWNTPREYNMGTIYTNPISGFYWVIKKAKLVLNNGETIVYDRINPREFNSGSTITINDW